MEYLENGFRVAIQQSAPQTHTFLVLRTLELELLAMSYLLAIKWAVNLPENSLKSVCYSFIPGHLTHTLMCNKCIHWV